MNSDKVFLLDENNRSLDLYSRIEPEFQFFQYTLEEGLFLFVLHLPAFQRLILEALFRPCLIDKNIYISKTVKNFFPIPCSFYLFLSLFSSRLKGLEF